MCSHQLSIVMIVESDVEKEKKVMRYNSFSSRTYVSFLILRTILPFLCRVRIFILKKMQRASRGPLGHSGHIRDVTRFANISHSQVIGSFR